MAGAAVPAPIATFMVMEAINGTRVDTVRQEVISSSPLLALRDRTGISGQFYLGSGKIENQYYYYWYSKDADGAIMSHRMPQDGVRIFEEDRTDGAVQTARYGHKPADPHFDLGRTSEDIEFHIPVGSIQRGFNL